MVWNVKGWSGADEWSGVEWGGPAGQTMKRILARHSCFHNLSSTRKAPLAGSPGYSADSRAQPRVQEGWREAASWQHAREEARDHRLSESIANGKPVLAQR